jgi:hypothetical protein
MKVTATSKGFFDGEVRNYNDQTQKGDSFVIEARSDECIIKHRKDASDKKVTDAERSADVNAQFSAKWMKKA